MENREEDRVPRQELSELREPLSNPKALPCGNRVCLRCHKGCGVAMAAYLNALDELRESGEENP
jgi:hypothetical protein